MVLDFSVYAHSRWTCVNHFLLILRNLVNHYVANPFTIHQRLYIYIYLYIACHDISHRITRIYPRRENHPWRFNRFTHRTHSYTPCHLSRYLSIVLATYVYDTPYNCTDLRLSKFSLRSFFQVFALSFFFFFSRRFSRYDTITIDLCIAMGNYIEPHRPEHSLLTACSITEKYQSP